MIKTKLCLLTVVLAIAALACSMPSSPSQEVLVTEQEAQNEIIETQEPTQELEALAGEAYLPMLKLPEVELLTPTENAGKRPLFEWSSVPDAAWYSLVLKNGDGKPYWAWMGTQTRIYLGGSENQPPEESAGPVLSDGMRWAVVAYDKEGKPIASSRLRQISP